MIEESAEVASELGVTLPVSIDHRLERGLAVGAHKPSTLQDLEAGKPLEIECLTGAVVELAGGSGWTSRRPGRSTPACACSMRAGRAGSRPRRRKRR